MVIEPRKLQRLGSSSLVVTLPRKWVKRLGLSAGDIVYISTEGDTLRIIPAKTIEAETRSEAIFYTDKLEDETLVSKAVSCLYILGYDNVLFKVDEKNFRIRNLIKAAAARLSGFEASESLNGDIVVKYLLDPSKVDATTAIKGVGVIVSSLAKLVKGILEGVEKNEARRSLQLLRQELFKNQHTVMRYLVNRVGITSAFSERSMYSLMIGTSLLGLIGGILVDIVSLLLEEKPTNKNTLMEAASILEEVVPVVASLLVDPGLQRTIAILNRIEEAIRLVGKAMKACQNNIETITLTLMFESFRVLTIISNTILCNAIAASKNIMEKE